MKMNKKIAAGACLLVAVIIFSIYYFIIKNGIRTDIQTHARYTKLIFEGKEKMLPNFLYFSCVYLFTFGAGSLDAYFYSSVFLITLALTAKFYLSGRYFFAQAGIAAGEKQSLGIQLGVFGVTLMMLFLFAIPWSYPLGELYYYYLGKVPPTIWHNSTSIFVIPFTILLFLGSYRIIENRELRNSLAMSVLVILNIAIKPSYFFVYLAVFPLFLFFKEGITKRFFRLMIPAIIGVVYIAVQFYVFYIINVQFGTRNTGKSGIAIAPFEIWANIITFKMIPFALVSSLLLPIVYYLIYYREIIKGINLYAIVTFAVALLIFIFFVETGPRRNDGNFIWQSFICCYFLFLVVVANCIRKFFEGKFRSGPGKLIGFCLSSAFLLHVVSGVIYLYRIFHYKSYY
jgi:hypothetical protein